MKHEAPDLDRHPDELAERELRSLVIAAQVYPPQSAFLREQLVTGELSDGTPFELALEARSTSLLFKVGDEPWLAVSPHELVHAFLNPKDGAL